MDKSLLSLKFATLLIVLAANIYEQFHCANLEKLAEKKGRFENDMIAKAKAPAVKPHSCDAKRLISYCNLITPQFRNSFSIKTQICICTSIATCLQ